MTIRSKTFADRTVHAGPREELIELAKGYAVGDATRAADRPFFARAVEHLSNGVITAGTDTVRFWCDSPDGTPFKGPRDWCPPAA